MMPTKMRRRLRISGTMVFLGLIVELVSLLWSTPTAFILFLMPGALLMATGILVYLYSLVSVAETHGEEETTDRVKGLKTNSVLHTGANPAPTRR